MGEKQRLSKHSLLKLGCGGCVHLYIADGVEPNCWINSGRGIPKPCLDRLNFDEARSLKAELRALGAKFRLDVGIMLENQRKLTEERNALKEQLGKLMKFMASVENFDYIWTNHSNIPQFYTMITKGHYATCVDARKRVDDAESRLSAARKHSSFSAIIILTQELHDIAEELSEEKHYIVETKATKIHEHLHNLKTVLTEGGAPVGEARVDSCGRG